jgi:hypothetical protein
MNATQPITILPCPFCAYADVEFDEVSPGVVAITCPDCGAIGPHFKEGSTTPQAIFGWNSRKTFRVPA